MLKTSIIAAALLTAGLYTSGQAMAEETTTTTKTETVRNADGTVVLKEKEVRTEEGHTGNWFTRFWIHDVGDPLKKGVHKVDRTLNNIGKDDDEPRRVETKTEVKTETKTEVRRTEPEPLR